jgi:chitinase
MKFSKTMLAAFLASLTEARFNMYWDEWHTEAPSADVLSKVTHITTAFATSTTFNSGSSFTPFETVQNIKSTYGSDKKVIIAIGGWGDTSGFSNGAENNGTRATYAKNVAAMLESTGADGVDIDWEYPGGNGDDYKQTPNSQKVDEIQQYPEFLAQLRAAIGPNKELSIAVPGLARDMIAFTQETGPKIWPSVDIINVMAYDLMNRRDNVTKHASSVEGAKASVQNYLDIGAPADKINLGFPFYAKWFKTASDCSSQPLGCPTMPLEDAQGADTGNSGSMTFEANPVDTPPAGVAESWTRAQAGGKLDEQAGGEYFFDAQENIFWTWDTEDIIEQKFTDIIDPLKVGGAMAWSLGEDTDGWKHIAAISNQL